MPLEITDAESQLCEVRVLELLETYREVVRRLDSAQTESRVQAPHLGGFVLESVQVFWAACRVLQRSRAATLGSLKGFPSSTVLQCPCAREPPAP